MEKPLHLSSLLREPSRAGPPPRSGGCRPGILRATCTRGWRVTYVACVLRPTISVRRVRPPVRRGSDGPTLLMMEERGRAEVLAGVLDGGGVVGLVRARERRRVMRGESGTGRSELGAASRWMPAGLSQ